MNFFKKFYIALKTKAKYPHNRSKFLVKVIKENFKNPSIMEVGVFEGDLSFYVFSKLNFKILTLLDPYILYEGNKSNTTLKDLDERYERVKKKFNGINNTDLLRINLNDFVSNPKYNNSSYDFIYIDGDHSFEGAYLDLKNAEKILNKKGIIAIDDYGDISCYGITKAVNKFLSEYSNFYIYDLQHRQLLLKTLTNKL